MIIFTISTSVTARSFLPVCTRHCGVEVGIRSGSSHVIISFLDTKASEKLSAIVCNKNFCCDVKKLSPVHQTSKCEAFHSLVNNFSPKSTAFSYHGMLSRSVSMLHIHARNERGGRGWLAQGLIQGG
jgi:hypothetical protein